MNRHKLLLTLALTIITSSLYAKSCYQVKPEDIKVAWTAYKTPAKAGVSGKLPNVTFSGTKKAESIETIIKRASLKIDASVVATKNPARDKKISNFFFGNMKGGKLISAKVVSLKKKTLRIEIMMNKQRKVVPMTYEISNSLLTATGHVDVLDFQLSKSLAAINKACFALHEGKTWSDVKLSLKVKFTKCQ